jgi:hypothetical protein
MNVPQIAQFRTSMECVLIENDLKEYINIVGMDLNLTRTSNVTQNVMLIKLLFPEIHTITMLTTIIRKIQIITWN